MSRIVHLRPRYGGRPAVRTAVVGAGARGRRLAQAVMTTAGAELVAICDRSTAALTRVSPRFPEIRMVGDFTEILEDPSVEAVVVATPVQSHYRLITASLAAGKHVLVEKPFAASYREARELSELAERLELTLMPAHVLLYSRPVEYVKSLIDLGRLGEVHYVSSSRVSLGQHQADASVVWDLAPHELSILLHWIDEAPTVTAAIARACTIPGKSDVVFANLAYPSGRVAHVELSWLVPGTLRHTTLVGSEKSVVYDDSAAHPVRVFDTGVEPVHTGGAGESRLRSRIGDVLTPRIDPSEPMALLMADFIAAVTRGCEPRSHVRLGLEVMRLIEEVEHALVRAPA